MEAQISSVSYCGVLTLDMLLPMLISGDALDGYHTHVVHFLNAPMQLVVMAI